MNNTLPILPEKVTTSNKFAGRTVDTVAWAHFGDKALGQPEIVYCWTAYENANKHSDARVLVGRRYEDSMANAVKAAAEFRPTLLPR